jgi:hypothetical protein
MATIDRPKVAMPTYLSLVNHWRISGRKLASLMKIAVSGRAPAMMREAKVPTEFAFFQYKPIAVVSSTLAEYMVPVIAMNR